MSSVGSLEAVDTRVTGDVPVNYPGRARSGEGGVLTGK